MGTGKREETALGSARGRFLESLPSKAVELRSAIDALGERPDAVQPCEEARRRLHALYASALVFRSEPLAALAQEGIGCLDCARNEARPLSPVDLTLLSGLIERIAALQDERLFSSRPPPSSLPAGAKKSGGLRPSAAAVRASSLVPARRTGMLGSLSPVSLQDAEPAGAARSPVMVHGFRGPAQSGAFLSEAKPPAEEEGSRALPDEAEKGASAQGGALALHGEPLPGGCLLQRGLRVLLVSSAERQAELRMLVGAAPLRWLAASSAGQALEQACQDAPDVVISDVTVAHEELIRALRADPRTDFVPVVLWSPEGEADGELATDADAVLGPPLQRELVIRTLGRVTGSLLELSATRPQGPAEATLEELAEQMSAEIRRGLLDGARPGRPLRIPLDPGDAELKAAALSAVAHLRALVCARSAGQLGFADPADGPVPLVLAGEGLAGWEREALRDRRLLVVDEDDALTASLARILRQDGATAIQAHSAAQALRLAQPRAPDLVISAAWTPNLDGFALSQAFKREPLLAHVPVVVIPSRDALWARLRDVASGADAAHSPGAREILRGLAAVLGPQRKLEQRLQGPDEVRGNLEEVGIVPLLRAVCRARPGARVTLRDAWNLFECELGDGRLMQLTRTASDGSFGRNERALPQLLGVGRARYCVAAPRPGAKHAIQGTLEEALSRGAQQLGAQLDAVGPSGLARVTRVVFDEDAHAALLENAPEPTRSVLARLAAGAVPLALAREGVIDASIMVAMLASLVRRGAICAVQGSEGEDLVAGALAQRVQAAAWADDDGQAGSAPELVPAVTPPDTPAQAAVPEADAIQAPPSPVFEPAPSKAAPVAAAPAPAEAVSEDPVTRDAASEARRSHTTLLAWASALVALVAVGFLLDSVRAPEVTSRRLEAIGSRPPELQPAAQLATAPALSAKGTHTSQFGTTFGTALAQPSVVKADDGGFTVYQGILETNVAVAPEQGLVVVEAPADMGEARLSVDDLPVGALPASVALSEGVHEVAIRYRGAVSYRFVSVKRGHTFVLSRL